jgi:site-specific DNA-adenine methylase
MIGRLHPFFSYFGAKWRAAPHYPAPKHGLVVEPFAGSACYSLYHHQMKVILADIDPTIANLWRWLIAADANEIEAIPENVDCLDDLPTCTRQEARDLVGFWFVKGSVSPVTKKFAWARTGNWDSQFWGPEIKRRIINQLPYIRHWGVVCEDYRNLPDVEACWFVDPPYQRHGRHYVHGSIDYRELAFWCHRRRGQLIVCEQEGAEWMNFQKFRTIKSLKSRTSAEVFYARGGQS